MNKQKNINKRILHEREKLVGFCERRMSRAGKLLEAAKNAEAASKQMMHFALAEFADARRELDLVKEGK